MVDLFASGVTGGIDLFSEDVSKEQIKVEPEKTFGGYPSKISDEMVEPGPVGQTLKAGMEEVWQGVKATPETAGALLTGIPLWMIGKLRGTGELMRGHSVDEAHRVEEEIAAKGIIPKTEAGKSAVGMVGDVVDVITWPARKAGETLTNMGYPKSGYLLELGAELATFKAIGELKSGGAKAIKERSTAKAVFDKKMSALTDAQRAEVTKIAETKVKSGRDLRADAKFDKLSDFEKSYEIQKDIWFGKRDRGMFEADIESRLLKKEIKESYKPTSEPEYVMNPAIKLKGVSKPIEGDYAKGGHIEIVNQIDENPRYKEIFDRGEYVEGGVTDKGRFVERKPQFDFGDDIKGRNIHEIKDKLVDFEKIKPSMYEEAIQIYIDLKSHPEHLDKYYDMLSPEQKKVVDLSQSLPPEIKSVAEKIAKSYEVIGKEAQDATVIRNMIENYAARQWDLGPGKSIEAMRKFGTTTGHAKARRLGSILEGWAEGYDLKTKSAVENLRIYKHEIIKTMADKQFVDELMKLKDIDGNPLLSTQKLEGYVRVKHPNMTKWEWAGEIQEGQLYGKNSFLTEDGKVFEKRDLYAPKKQAKNLNNILGISSLAEVPGIKGITKFNEITKAWILQSSLFHHQAFLRSYYLPGGFDGKGQTPRQAYRSGIEAIEKSDPILMHGVERGLTIGLKQDWDPKALRESTVLGRQLDRLKATKIAKDKINNFRQAQADFLFGEFGAGLKAKAYILEFRDQMKKYPDANPDVVATRVANLINDDFGGLHLQRLGRNPTTQHIFRLFALAPDWTESNIRTMVKTLKNKTGDQAELEMYRRFWGGVVFKAAGVTALANYALAGGDVDEMMDNYEKAWKSGNFNWMKVDITPLYEGIYNMIGESPSGQKKYFGIAGHFLDAPKFVAHPIRSAKHKQSVTGGMALEAVSGTDYTGVRRFTTFEELLQGEGTVKFGGGGAVDWDQFPSYALSQLMGTQPIQVQALIGWMAGEKEGFDAISDSLGLRVTTTYEKKSRMKRGLRKMQGLK